MKPLPLFVILIVLSSSGFSQKQYAEIKENEIPALMKHKGNLIACCRWIDELGTNYLILSESGISIPPEAVEAAKHFELMTFNGRTDTVYSMEADFRQKELYAWHYLQKQDTVSLLWKLQDFIKDCAFDLTLEYLIRKPIITDLDNNGVCESWMLYWLGCRSDVSGMDMKLIMHEGKNKYAIRGTRKIRYGPEMSQSDGGSMKLDDALMRLPKKIKEYSIELWRKYESEN